MKVRSKREFFEALSKSKLLSASEQSKSEEAARGHGGADAVARLLVESEQLTRWQADQLLGGHTNLCLGKYKLLKVCGRGGMGTVFKAVQPGVNRAVAIKVLHKSLLNNPRAVSRFQREIQLAGALNHPNIVTAFDAGKINGSHFLVMEYVSGKTLKFYCEKHGRLPIAFSIECIRQAAIGLMHIHEVGLVHRDIKPSNIFVIHDSPAKSPRIKILDVGLSRFASEAEQVGSELTNAGQYLGTVHYMPPEQVKDAHSADIRADIFGLGATLFQLLTGEPPLAGKTLMQTYLARIGQDAPAVSTLRPEVPAALDGIVAKMLHRDPEHRFQTPGELVEALDAFVAGDFDVRPKFSAVKFDVPQNVQIDPSLIRETIGSTASMDGESDANYLAFLEEMSLNEFSDPSSTSIAMTQFSKQTSAKREMGLYVAARRWLQSWIKWSPAEQEVAVAAHREEQPERGPFAQKRNGAASKVEIPRHRPRGRKVSA